MANERLDLPERPSEPSPEDRLNSWKEIAAYLKCSERTVRRWEEEGLPVHRHTHKAKAAIYAYKPEINAWWNDGHERLRQIEDLQEQRPAATVLWRNRIWSVVGAILAAALVAILCSNVGGLHDRLFGKSPRLRIESLAVLPLENLSQDSDQEYFSDGITDALITDLAQIGSLKVISRTSSMQYKRTKKSLPQIARELHVDGVVEGTVQRYGDRVRITAQLLYGPTDKHIWAQSYDRSLRDVLALQNEVASEIAQEIDITLTPQEKIRLATVRPVNPEAHEAYLKGRYYLAPRRGQRDLKMALDYFQRAIQMDPNFALAYASLAETYNAMNTFYLPPLEAGPKAKAAAMKALELDGTLPLAHASLGRVHLFYDWDWPGAEQEFLRSLELNPNLPEAHLGYSQYLASIGRFDKAIEQARIAFALDPLSVNARFVALSTTFHVTRRYQETLQECRKVKELPPNFTEPFGEEAFVYARLGQFQEAAQAAEAASRSDDPTTVALAAEVLAESGNTKEARKLLRELLAATHEKFVCGNNISTVFGALGEVDTAFYWLREGVKQRSL